MVDIVRRMGWSYISIIYEESNYGLKAFEELEDLLSKHNICIAIKEKLVKDSGVAAEAAYDLIVQKLLTKSRARGECGNTHFNTTQALNVSASFPPSLPVKMLIKRLPLNRTGLLPIITNYIPSCRFDKPIWTRVDI